MRRIFRLVGLFVLLAAGPACRNAADLRQSDASGVTVPENRSQVEATVLQVEPLDEHRFRLTLGVDAAVALPGYRSLVQKGNVIDVFPNFVRAEGQAIDYEADVNQNLLDARSLIKGAKIRAEVQRTGGGNTSSWLLMKWEPVS